ncbi:unnamed protein product [Caenorhabditis bovis]|uniref:T-box domain-containing protein n=1 Tax=Caenorhabditis bovis TaxID=2654633 RepID=A0A8S1EN73_9PELO|nr:unnamed protein product [Caenorhabditis bovis]
MMDLIDVKVENEKLWENLFPNNEMIASKEGKKLCPELAYKVGQLEDDEYYVLEVHMKRITENRYRFVENEWIMFPDNRHPVPEMIVRHPDGCQNGKFWMERPVSFRMIKLVNDPTCRKEFCIPIQTLALYSPILRITKMNKPSLLECGVEIPVEQRNFNFLITQFFTGTSYSNSEIRNLKVCLNKYSRGVRDAKIRRGNQKMKLLKEKHEAKGDQHVLPSATNPYEFDSPVLPNPPGPYHPCSSQPHVECHTPYYTNYGMYNPTSPYQQSSHPYDQSGFHQDWNISGFGTSPFANNHTSMPPYYHSNSF